MVVCNTCKSFFVALESELIFFFFYVLNKLFSKYLIKTAEETSQKPSKTI